jgi:thioredoxin reductase (NADPH)
MSRYLIEQIEANPKIRVRLKTDLVEVHGGDSLEAITVRDSAAAAEERLTATAMFVLIGAMPNTDWLDGVVARDEQGFVLAGPDVLARKASSAWPLERDPYLLETSLPGVFVAGDVRSRSIKRVASGVGEGSMAVQFIHRYLGEL